MNHKQFEKFINQFKTKRDKNNQKLNMHDVLYRDDAQILHQNFREKKEKSDIRSISKTVLTLILGIVIEQSKKGKYPLIDEETYIYPKLKEFVDITNIKNIHFLKRVQIKHLLTHTIGYNDKLMMRDDIINTNPKDLLKFTINHPIIHEPGSYYLYSNAGYYILAAYLENFLKEDLLVYIKREFFDKLEIFDYNWEKYGDYCAGATRLWLYPEDLLKIGELFINNGEYKGKPLVNPVWLKTICKMRVPTPDVDRPLSLFRRYGYGYSMWVGYDDYYFGYGTDGQSLVILPKQRIIIMTLAYQIDMKPIEDILSEAMTEWIN